MSSALRIVLLGSPPGLELDERADVGADALLLICPTPPLHTAISAVAARVPLVIVTDTDAATAARLIAAGAADVLPASAGALAVDRSLRDAIARRRRETGNADTEGVLDVSVKDSSSTLVPPGAAADGALVAMPGRAPVPVDMPPHLRAVGQLAGGVAHDFNNLLQVIGGNAEVLLSGLDAADPRKAPTEAIVSAAHRAATLTHQLLAFARRQTLIATPLDLNALVGEAVAGIRARVGVHTRVVTQLAAGLPNIEVDKAQLLHVLTNLSDNAFDAMPDGGVLTLATEAIHVNEAMRSLRPWLTSGRFVGLRVTDTGSGIETDVLPHLFEPFFTTKSKWSGTGLGLSSVYGIVKQSGGFIWIDSEPGAGTGITILLPPASTSLPVSTPVQAAAVPPRARILLVEDDDAVRELLTGVLTHYRFSVAAYGTAEEALEHTQPFDVLVTDVLLPGANGPQLAQDFRRRIPHVPVLFISGDTGHAIDPKDVDAGGFLQKPFSGHTLVARLDELLKAAARNRDTTPTDPNPGRPLETTEI